MNDDFLYRIRTEPPAHFATGLKERLDAAPRRRAQALRFALGVLLFGTALAMAVPGVRHSIASLFTKSSVHADLRVARDAEVTAPSAAPAEPRVRGADAPSAESAARPATEQQLIRPAQPPAPHRAEASALSSATEETPDDANNAHDRSAAVALASRAREITNRDLFSGEIPAAWPVAADDAEARAAIATRRALFRVIAASFEPVDTTTRKQRDLDRDAVALSAYRLLQLATMIDDAYAIDTRRWNELESVNSLIWNRSGVFRREIQEFSAASRALLESAANGSPADIWRDAGRVSRSCWRCHDGFATRRDLPPTR